jgi:hypothetical protein
VRRAGLLAALAACLPAVAPAQEAPSGEAAREAAAQDTTAAQETAAAQDTTRGPEMAKAPLQFRLSGTAGAFMWDRKEGVVEIDDLANFGIDIESRVVPAVAFRLGASYGSTRAFNDSASVGVNQWQFDVSIVGRMAFAPFSTVGLVPFGMVGAGTVALDPRDDPDSPVDDDLVTRSQGAFSFGGGLYIEPERARWGGRVEYRFFRVSLEDPFNPVDRTGDTIGANALVASIFWKL